MSGATFGDLAWVLCWLRGGRAVGAHDDIGQCCDDLMLQVVEGASDHTGVMFGAGVAHV